MEGERDGRGSREEGRIWEEAKEDVTEKDERGRRERRREKGKRGKEGSKKRVASKIIEYCQ